MKMVDDNIGNLVRQNTVQNPSIQIVEIMNRLSVVLEITNQYRNGNVVTTPVEGNGNGIHDGSTEVSKDENCYGHDISNMLTHEVQYTDLQTELDRTKEKLENCIIKKKKEYVVLWNNIKDEKTFWEEIKTRLGGTKESKKMQKTILKRQYKNFAASRSKGLDKTYDRFQKLISQLEIHGEVISLEDGNLKFLRSLPPSWNTHTLIMQNKSDLDTLSMNDLYNNLKVYEAEIKDQSSSNSNSQNVAFVSLDNTSSTNEAVNIAHNVSAASSQGQAYTSTYADDIMFSFFANQSNSGHAYHEDEEIHKENKKESEFQCTSDSSVNESEEDNNQANDRYKAGEGYHAVPPPYTRNFMPPRPDLSFAGLDDSVFKSAISETVTSVHETKTSASKTSKESMEKPKTVRSNAPIIEDWESDSDGKSVLNNEGKTTGQREVSPEWNNAQRVNHQNFSNNLTHHHPRRNFVPTTVITNSGKVPVDTAKQRSPRAAVSTSTARHVNTAATRPIVNGAKSSSNGNPQYTLKDQGIFNSGCSRRMMRNKSFLTDYQEIDGGFVAFGGSPKGGKISGKGKIRTGKLDFKDVYFVKELKFNLFSVSQMRDKKNSVLFIETECLVLSPDFKLLDKNQVLLKVPRQNNIYSFDLKNIAPSGGLTYLFAKATIDKSNLWHRRLGHINFKTMNKLLRGNLVRGLPSKIFENDHTCVACQKGKQHKASCKTKLVSSISQPLQMLHMDLFGPAFIKILNNKMYFLVVTNDFSMFSWVFFLATKDETSGILKSFITGIENQINHRVKIIRYDNRIEFKNSEMNQFCQMKGIKKEFSVTKTPQQNGIAKRKNRTLIEAARTILADLILPTTLSPNLDFMKTFRCLVTIMNTLDHLGKFEEKANEGFLVRYSVNKINVNARKVRQEKASDHEFILLPFMHSNSPLLSRTYSLNNKDIDEVPCKGDEEETCIFDDVYDDKEVGAEADINNLELSIVVSPIPTTRVYKDHPKEQIIGDLNLSTQTKRMINFFEENAMVCYINKQRRTNHKDYQNYLFACLISQQEPIKTLRTKWVFRNKKDERGIVVRNKARLVVQGYTQEDGIDYNEVFAPVARIEASMLFLAYALFMGFTVYQMDVKSAFLYDTIEEEVYVDDIIFGSTKKSLCDEFEQIMHKRFQMSSMGELTFFLELQIKQKDDGIFISQDKYMADILKKFDFTIVKTASTLMDPNKALIKDVEAKDVPSYTKDFTSSCGEEDLDYARASLERKSTTREYVVATNCCGQVLWIQNQMLDYGFNFMNTKIYIDNENSYEKKLIQVIKIYADHNVADLLTKVFDVSSIEFRVKTGYCRFNAARQDLVLLGEDDRVVRAATTAASLEAEQKSGNINKTRPTTTLNEPSPQGTGLGGGPKRHVTTLGDTDAQTRFETTSKQSPDPPLSEVNTFRSNEDSMEHQDDLTNFVPPTPHDLPLSGGHTPRSDEDLVIKRLQKKVKILEKKQRARNPGMKRFKIGTFKKKTLDKEIDVNVVEPVSTAGDVVNTASVIPDGSAAGPSTSTAGDIFEDKMTTMADTLMAIRSTRPRTTSVVIHNVKEEPRRATPLPTINKHSLRESKRLLGAAEQKAKDAALIEQIEDVQVRIDADALLAERFQQEEREQFTVIEQARMLVDLIVERKRLSIQNAKSEIVCVMCKQCLVTANHDVCVLNYMNNMNSRADNKSANVSIRENKKKHKAKSKKSKDLWSKGSLASSRPSKPRTYLRWIPTGRIFSMCGKLTASSNTENKSVKSVCDNASTSNPSEPSSNGFSISTSLLGRLSRQMKQHISIYPIPVL
uniref:Ribonuclease H-like domain-containing protein n=1 Tax=Tanacetum cinerariifolium TaxID=118510 RepID=A0A6L2MQ55_TANCI|nr:ribonuclease H-like domain-containing protein [Tanacetum cinerariifolium]